jgi:hypothetical protein
MIFLYERECEEEDARIRNTLDTHYKHIGHTERRRRRRSSRSRRRIPALEVYSLATPAAKTHLEPATFPSVPRLIFDKKPLLPPIIPPSVGPASALPIPPIPPIPPTPPPSSACPSLFRISEEGGVGGGNVTWWGMG